jgi:hypothetical protein
LLDVLAKPVREARRYKINVRIFGSSGYELHIVRTCDNRNCETDSGL